MFFAPGSIDIECPNPECRRSLVNTQYSWKVVSGCLTTQHGCAGCGRTTRFFLLNPPGGNGSEALRGARLFQFPKPAIQSSMETGIAEVSPAFVEIHSQAEEAEALGLSFPGWYRLQKGARTLNQGLRSQQASERLSSDSKDVIGAVHQDIRNRSNVKSCAERAVWLGNDETHYVRRWPDGDLEDLKVLLKLTRYWISSELLTAQYGKDMPHPVQL